MVKDRIIAKRGLPLITVEIKVRKSDVGTAISQTPQVTPLLGSQGQEVFQYAVKTQSLSRSSTNGSSVHSSYGLKIGSSTSQSQSTSSPKPSECENSFSISDSESTSSFIPFKDDFLSDASYLNEFFNGYQSTSSLSPFEKAYMSWSCQRELSDPFTPKWFNLSHVHEHEFIQRSKSASLPLLLYLPYHLYDGSYFMKSLCGNSI